PTRLAYDDETFDAIVAWDVFNYYNPASARAVAAEARRVLKPGGLIFCYFHARQAHAPDPLRRYQILDETRVNSDALPGRRMQRHLYQNRDIEKMFTGLRIAELYFLKNSVREILMEKKLPEPAPKPRPEPATPKPRFTLE
ncbi:MAG TPA: class I SAM-dependent methyltransferase, partial [Candidatus Polarisedimenticolia bacterium]|nr:class I SAM-dependent methyltransferase [Candidatus Polarisedimenticolia bacterium]